MNREIKFRLWNSAGENSKMFYDTEQVMECLKQQVLFNDKFHKYHALGYDHEGNGSVFMQYTGLKDKNGKEIWEGDILKSGKSKYTTRVEYQSTCFVQHINEYDLRNTIINLDGAERLEVIGNVYEKTLIK